VSLESLVSRLMHTGRIFSICRFRELTGGYPRKITVVSYTFKRKRIEELHAAALGIPAEMFRYIGVDPSSETGFDLAASQEGELNNSYLLFKDDPYGCHSEFLNRKRSERNPFHRYPPYELTCPEIKNLLSWCGPQMIPTETLPWATFRSN